VAAALVLGLVFFVSGHDLSTSLAESYTQNAEQMEIAASGGNFLRRIAFLALGGFGCLLIATSQSRWQTDLPLAVSLSLLLGLTVVSFAWADDKGMCLRRLLILLCCATAAAGIARALSLREICLMIVWVLGSLTVIGLFAELRLGTLRPWAGDYRFAGTVHPNTQGPTLATLCLAALALADGKSRHRGWLWFIAATAFALLLLTKSRTATAAILASIAAVQLVKTRFSTKCAGMAAMLWVGAAGLWLVSVAGIDPLTDFREALLLGRADEADTLSGRAFIWPEVLSFASERFWLGYGYESFWTAERIETISDELGWGLREAHNAYLEALLWLGAVGVGLLLCVAATGLVASVRAWRRTGNAACTLPIGLLVFALINAGLESGMVAITIVPFLLACCLVRIGLFGAANSLPLAPLKKATCNYSLPVSRAVSVTNYAS
jgi:exopolysaccharide production protein ExoQ